ncbi:MAG: ribulose-phosphate 3-epimerase, partial [Catalinimonas sp.]
MVPLIAPSLLAADLSDLRGEARMFEASEGDWLHFDVMDGHFVPNLSFGLPVLRALRPLVRKPIDVHLMIENAPRYLKAYRDAGADRITVHAEAEPHLHRTVGAIRELGAAAGVALNPHTPPEVLEWVLPDLDQVLVMSVNPGFG